MFNVRTLKPGTQPNIIQSRKYFLIKWENKSFLDSFKIVLMKRKGYEAKAYGRPPPLYACVLASMYNVLKVSFWVALLCSTYARMPLILFSETFTNTFLFQSSSIHQFGIVYTYFIISRAIILVLIKLMTHSEDHQTNYSLLKKKKLLCVK